MKKEHKNLILIILAIILVGLGSYFFVYQNHTIPVAKDKYAGLDMYGGEMGSYYLYVPGDKSTCTWTFLENGKPESFTSYPDPKTGQQDFLYNSTVSNMQVECLNDQGVKYTGKF